jgi:hypothetical protein
MRRFALALCGILAAVPLAGRAQAPVPERPPWTAALYVDSYFLPGESGYFVPTLFADRDALHLEARWNYEDFDTLSLWGGWGFTFGGEERYAKLTPMVGAVAGATSGVAPGLEIDARWGRVTYWLEAEYVFDLKDSAGNYLYTWSELYVTVVPWLWLGGSLQRLKVVDSPNEVDVGPMIGVGNPGPHGWSISAYAYGLTRSSPTWLVTGALLF